ncbi:hypothetical protein SKAU_G00041360 [Synaphobranchus kaupii]|uniref:Uncharacterized protein n=1 Tax=Synaphobranchus kaupii TaxID=118154 RepID=A0A9Q1G1L1_SYNKA|nr:hypothetical protein SKAU_G00041360 [Synaphobranchus kaupii]
MSWKGLKQGGIRVTPNHSRNDLASVQDTFKKGTEGFSSQEPRVSKRALDQGPGREIPTQPGTRRELSQWAYELLWSFNLKMDFLKSAL